MQFNALYRLIHSLSFEQRERFVRQMKAIKQNKALDLFQAALNLQSPEKKAVRRLGNKVFRSASQFSNCKKELTKLVLRFLVEDQQSPNPKIRFIELAVHFQATALAQKALENAIAKFEAVQDFIALKRLYNCLSTISDIYQIQFEFAPPNYPPAMIRKQVVLTDLLTDIAARLKWAKDQEETEWEQIASRQFLRLQKRYGKYHCDPMYPVLVCESTKVRYLRYKVLMTIAFLRQDLKHSVAWGMRLVRLARDLEQVIPPGRMLKDIGFTLINATGLNDRKTALDLFAQLSLVKTFSPLQEQVATKVRFDCAAAIALKFVEPHIAEKGYKLLLKNQQTLPGVNAYALGYAFCLTFFLADDFVAALECCRYLNEAKLLRPGYYGWEFKILQAIAHFQTGQLVHSELKLRGAKVAAKRSNHTYQALVNRIFTDLLNLPPGNHALFLRRSLEQLKEISESPANQEAFPFQIWLESKLKNVSQRSIYVQEAERNGYRLKLFKNS